MEKGKMSLTIAVIIFVVVVAILVFISINNKSKNAPANSDLGDTQTMPDGSTPADNNMDNLQNDTEPSTAPDAGTTPSSDASGVSITVVKQGTGVAAKAGDSVTVNYTGKLADGTVFDSNVDPQFQHVEPFTFTLGAGQVIKGWDIGVAGMKVGEERTLVIQPDEAYGADGAGGGLIPPNAVLTFDVTLTAINPQ